MSPADRRSQLRDLYGFDFPDDLFRFWEFAKRLRPLEPLRALEDACGPALFEAVRIHLEHRQRDYEDLLEEKPAHAASYQEPLREIDRVRRVLMRYATGRRTATGLAYTDRWDYRKKRLKRVTAMTQEHMG